VTDHWYFEWDGKTFGPFSGVELKDLAALGRLQPTDLVWKEGTDKHVIAAKVKHLFPHLHTGVPASDAHDLAASEPALLRAPPHTLYPSVQPEGKKLAPWASLTNYRPVADERLRGLIPDELSLKAMPAQRFSDGRKADANESEDG